ncbi:hypothetical protein ES702_05807 [subsurface metagenome]
MFYAFRHTVDHTNGYTYPYEADLRLTAGVIHQVDVLFQDGCDHLVDVQIFQGGFQIWPSNHGGTLRANATAISFREFYELFPGDTTLIAKIDADASIQDIDVIIQIGLLPKRVLQPLSFEELLAAAAGIE